MRTPELIKFLRFALKEIIQQEDLINPTGFIVTREGVGVVSLAFKSTEQGPRTTEEGRVSIAGQQDALKHFGSIIRQSTSKEAALVLDVITKKYKVEPNQTPTLDSIPVSERDSAILMLHVKVRDKDLDFNVYMQPYVKAMEGYAFADDLVTADQIDEAITKPIKEGFLD